MTVKLLNKRRPLERVMTRLQNEVRHAEDLLRSTAENSEEHVGELRVRLQGALESAQDAMHKVEKRAVACARTTKETMRDHVLESVGVALGVGLLLGIIFGRR